MRITRRPSPSGVSGLEDAGGIAPSGFTPPSSGEPSTDDRVDLSNAARLRQRLRADLGSLEQTDAGRIASLRASVAGDTYKPAPEAVATSLIGEITADLLV
jgi:hypothetical protein